MPNSLLLRLEGPLQSWGEHARWTIRDTALEPTKSGVIGLLACAAGISNDDEIRRMARELRFGVRCDKSGSVLKDYHTVSGGVMSAEGKVKVNQATKAYETVVSERAYLCDASFLAVVQGPASLIERMAAAIQDPVWTVFLGRKACVPSRPIYESIGDFDTLEAALAHGLLGTARAVVECAAFEGVMRRDQFDSRAHRTYLPRYVREITIVGP